MLPDPAASAYTNNSKQGQRLAVGSYPRTSRMQYIVDPGANKTVWQGRLGLTDGRLAQCTLVRDLPETELCQMGAPFELKLVFIRQPPAVQI